MDYTEYVQKACPLCEKTVVYFTFCIPRNRKKERIKKVNIELSTMSTELSTVVHCIVYKKEFTIGNRKSHDFWGKIELITLSYQQYPQAYPQVVCKNILHKIIQKVMIRDNSRIVISIRQKY